jgi:hypothetical protein
MSTNANIGSARKQVVFATLETTIGTIVFPVGTTDFILPAGNAQINQNPAFVDSEELKDTLDVLDRFQNPMPPGKWSLPMYLRPSGYLLHDPQGSVLLQCLQGVKNAVTTAAVSSAVGAADTTVVLKTIAEGVLPETGVVGMTSAGTINEYIHYTGITRVSRSATTATLTGCTRGYKSSTAATHAVDQPVTLKSIFYRQAVASPSFTLWVQSDHMTQGLTGCSIDEGSVEITNEGAVKCNLSGQGMKMVFAGTSTLSGAALATNTHIHVTDASLYSADAYIYNPGVPASTYIKITTVNRTTNILTLAAACGAAWASGDTIKGYLPPSPTIIGDPIECADTTISVAGVTVRQKGSTLSIKTPKKYVDDEVGTDYPEDFLDDKRDVTSTMNLYFRKADGKYFADGIAADENAVKFTLGNVAGSIMDIYMKRCSLEVPTINFASPAIELSIPFKAMGTVGEDSVEIVLR